MGLDQQLRDALAHVAALAQQHEEIVAASELANSDDEHDPEGATIAFERAQLAALLQQARQSVRDLERAVERLKAGTYGVCERCGGPIGAERLEAKPGARSCIACAPA